MLAGKVHPVRRTEAEVHLKPRVQRWIIREPPAIGHPRWLCEAENERALAVTTPPQRHGLVVRLAEARIDHPRLTIELYGDGKMVAVFARQRIRARAVHRADVPA